VFPQALDLILVQQACAQDGIPMQGEKFQKMVQDEIQRSIKTAFPDLTPEQRVQGFGQLLQRYGKTEEEFLIAMNVAAGLRALSTGRVEAPTDAEIEEGFKAQYGPKVEIRVITVKSMEDAAAVREQIKSPDDVMRAAQSKGAQVQSMTISANDTHPELKMIKEAAESLQEHQLSPIIPQNVQNGAVYHLVYLDKKFAAQTVTKASVESKVKEAVTGYKEQAWMSAKMQQLQAKCTFDLKNPILKSQYDQILAAQRAATQAAATQPGAATRPAK
jgi:hypothetical protein